MAQKEIRVDTNKTGKRPTVTGHGKSARSVSSFLNVRELIEMLNNVTALVKRADAYVIL